MIYGTLESDLINYPLSKQLNKIGRSPLTNNIVLNHQSISKDHAIIEFDNDKIAYISDLHSSNGTFLNGQKISQTSKALLKPGDIIRFGKDPNMFKFNSISTFLPSINTKMLYNNNLFNSQPLIRPNDANNLESEILLKQKEVENISLSYSQLNDEYNKLNAKHNALLQYASDIQKKNDFLEFTIKEKNKKIEMYENKDINKILLEKEAMIKILQSENSFYNTELQKIKNAFNSQNASSHLDLIINEYLTQISFLRRTNEEYKAQFIRCDKKWSELLKVNDSLKMQIDAINKRWSEDIDKYVTLQADNDKRLSDALAQIPQCYDGFNVNKEEAAKYLVTQVNTYLNEKQNILYENSNLSKQVCDLIYENGKLKDEICVTSSRGVDYNIKAMRDKIDELNDVIIQLQTANSPEKKIEYENVFKKLEEDISLKEQMIQELKEKLAQAMHNSNLFFDEKQVVNSITQAIKSRDVQIEKLKNKLKESGVNM